MAVMLAPRDEDRIDALATQVAVLAVRMDEGFKRMDERFEQVDKRFERLEDRFERMQRMMFGAAVLIITALITAPHL